MLPKVLATTLSAFSACATGPYPTVLRISHLLLRLSVTVCTLSILLQPVGIALCSRLPLICGAGGEMAVRFYWFWGLSAAGVLLHFYLNSVAVGLTWNQAEDAPHQRCLASNQKKNTFFAMSYLLFWIFSPAYLLLSASR